MPVGIVLVRLAIPPVATCSGQACADVRSIDEPPTPRAQNVENVPRPKARACTWRVSPPRTTAGRVAAGGGAADSSMSVAATNGIHTVIFLSFSLALGFLLVILSCAVWSNWMPIWSALSFALAPTPNACFGHLAGADSFSDYHDAYLDMGYFLTGALLMTGIALPIVLAHTGIITGTAAVLTLCGGLLVYGTSTCTPTYRRSDGLCRLLSYPRRVR